jgi:L-asparaginase/Glu-tRNA(Gln) amidotransferase subunit D
MNSLWKAEPTLILAFVSACVSLGVGFGLHVTTEQAALIQTVVISGLALVNRSQVTSGATLAAMQPQALAQAQATPEPVGDIVKKLP